ncbi:MAG TPA: cell division protein FtsA [Candidatus Angelobacter sp.]|nr:cell division protein FtsA [Candidatus Angelobacter sp.]
MFDQSSVIVGLETGTSKICAVVGEVNDAGALSIIGVGQSRSRGVRKGEIVDATLASEDIRNAIVEAEQMADVEVRSVYLGVSGGHLRGFNNRGVHPVVSADREITDEDVQDAIKNAKAINLPAENHVVHVIRQHFRVDGQDGIQNPVGMLGAKVEVDVHVVHGNFNRLQNPIRAVKSLQLEVEDIVFNGLASSLALLSNEQKELGALVIDIGGGTTEYVICADGIVKHTGLLAVGGDHVSNDLAYGLKVPLSRAEQLKVEHSSVLVDESVKGQTIPIANSHGLVERSINLEHLRRIVSLRLEEIFRLIAQEVGQTGLLDYLRSGVYLCGGGARIPGIQEMAGQVFGMPVSLGKTNSISGLKSALDQPEFATAIGLAKFGSFQTKKRAGRGGLGGIRSKVGQLIRAVKK